MHKKSFTSDELELIHTKKNADNFVVGDLCFLNSGGPAMKVTDIEGDTCEVDMQGDTHNFPAICLTKIEQGVVDENGYYEPVTYN
jgi:hypothetical protein